MNKEFNYVYNYIKSVFSIVDELKNDDLVKSLTIKLLTSMSNIEFSTSNYDFCIDNFVSQEMRKYGSKSYEKFENLKRYIFILMKGEPSIKISHLISYLSNYPYEDVILGKYEREIKKMLKLDDEELSDEEYVEEYVRSYLNRNSFMFDINENMEDVSLLISEYLITCGVNLKDVLSQECDGIINCYLMNNSSCISMIEECKRISNLVRKHVTYFFEESQEIDDETFRITRTLISEGYKEENLKSEECNLIIENQLRLDRIIKKSKEVEDQTKNRFESKAKKDFQNIKIKPIILAAAIIISASSLTACGYNFEEDNAYQMFDTYNYPNINGEFTNEFSAALEHILKVYPEYESYGEEYAQICLYKVFLSFKTEPYDSMDDILAFLKQKTRYSEELKTLYDAISPYDSYVEYVYDNMLLAGKKVDNEDYRKAVREYDSQVCNYKGLNPWSVTSKKSRASINALFNKYSRYIKSLENELGKKLVENERNK